MRADDVFYAVAVVGSGRINAGSKVLFAHLGGQPALNAYSGVF